MADPDPNYSLDQYINQLRNTIHAAYEDGYDRTEIHNRFEGLLFELRDDHQPRIETPEDLEAELDMFLRDAYLPTDEVVDVLDSKVEELEEIGEDTSEEEIDGEGPIDPPFDPEEDLD